MLGGLVWLWFTVAGMRWVGLEALLAELGLRQSDLEWIVGMELREVLVKVAIV